MPAVQGEGVATFGYVHKAFRWSPLVPLLYTMLLAAGVYHTINGISVALENLRFAHFEYVLEACSWSFRLRCFLRVDSPVDSVSTRGSSLTPLASPPTSAHIQLLLHSKSKVNMVIGVTASSGLLAILAFNGNLYSVANSGWL
jgi:hypothetical protein